MVAEGDLVPPVTFTATSDSISSVMSISSWKLL